MPRENQNVEMPDKPKIGFDTDIHKLKERALDILNNKEKVQNSLAKIKNTLHFINGTGPYESEKLEDKTFDAKTSRFLGTEEKPGFLEKFRQKMESPEGEISKKEDEQLAKIEEKLLSKSNLIEKITNELLAVQTVDLHRENLPKDKIVNERKHTAGVSILSQVIFKDSPLLHLIAPIHDFVKLNVGYTELGLHEIASAFMGPIALTEVLKDYQNELDLTDDNIELIGKIAQRAIYTHGDQEFPQKMSSPVGRKTFIKNLFGGIYILTGKRSVVRKTTEPTVSEKVIAQMNYVDALEGTSYHSFIKYNGLNPLAVIIDANNIEEYIVNNLLSSFDSNIGMDSGSFLRKLKNPALEKIFTFNTLVKNIIVAIAKGQDNEVLGFINQDDLEKIKINLENLKILHLKLKNNESIENNREAFNAEIKSFMIKIYNAVNKKVG